jgi:predicted RND superfamily exporter protein
MSSPSGGSSEPGPRTRAFVAWTLRYGRWIWLIALLLAIPAGYKTANLYIHLRSELDQLLPREAPSVLAIEELRSRMPGLQYLGVLVEVNEASQLPAAERMVDDLATRVRAYPPELVRTARTGVTEERDFVRAHAALFMDLADVRTIRERIEARRDHEAARAMGTLLDDEPAPSVDFSDLEEKYKKRDPTAGKFPGGRFSSVEQRTTLLLIEVGGFSTGAEKGRNLMDRVKADLADLGGPERYGPGMRVAYTGDVAISVEELSGLVADLSVSSVLVIIATIAVIVLYFRWWRAIPVLLVPLSIGTLFSFALVTLPPLRVSELNSNTAFMGSIIVGNGINSSIIILARYMEERRGGATVEQALSIAIWGTRTSTFAAALAASVSYGSLGVTQFRGFKQFGAIGGIGMLICWATAFVLFPPLVAWLDGGKIPAVRKGGGIMDPIARVVSRIPAPIVILSLIATTASIYKVSGFTLSELEHDFSRLRRASTWTDGEGYWGRKMDALLGRYLTPTVILADSPAEARAIAAVMRKEAAAGGSLAERIANVKTIDDVLPTEQDAKIAELQAIKDMLTPRLLAQVPEDKRIEVTRLLSSEGMKRLTPADLPPTLTTGMREKTGEYDRVVLIYPRPNKALWQGPLLIAYVAKLRAIADKSAVDAGGKPARVAGSYPLTADIIGAVEHDGPIAAFVSLLGVIAVIVVMFRGRRSTVFVVGSLLAGVAWFVALTLTLGVRVNFTNFIALPITFGIGADYAVNVMGRYEHEKNGDIGAAIRGTGGAVGLCSATTIIGYSSLLVADNRALFSFGFAAVLGEIACLTCAVISLPALLLLWSRFRGRSSSTPAPEASS